MTSQVQVIRRLFKITDNSELLCEHVQKAIEEDGPLALYQCAQSISRLEWVLDSEYIAEVIGKATLFRLIAKGGGKCLPLIILKKVGDMSVLYVSKAILLDVLEELKSGSLE